MVFVRLATGPPKKPPGPNRPVIQYGLLRAVKSSGAVSPATRTIASVAPVMSPPRAALQITPSVAFQRGARRAHHGSHARYRARRRRDGAAALHRSQQPVLDDGPVRTGRLLRRPGPNRPVIQYGLL